VKRPRTITPDAYLLPTQLVSETAETEPYLKPVFFGEAVPVTPWPADRPLPVPPLAFGELAPTLSALTPMVLDPLEPERSLTRRIS